ncbi:hypothetical protein SH528x_002666 [Novipirellula sp. SH528]|uniref:hypothetical protein n=1 Tax=Novipirellula sp. SH528 TaxID=3454466 RepID=UPI003FA068BE
MNELERLRSDPCHWGSIAFAARHTDERGTYDGNADARLRVLLTLQYDRRDSDIELIRHLLTHEIIAAENDSFQGCSDPLKLAAFLLATFRDPADASLFARAKLANFDTVCGFPIQFIFVSNRKQAEQNIKANDPGLWDHLASSFDISMMSDDLNQWWQSICCDYPDSEDDEDVLALYERALSFGERDRALHYLEKWAAQEPDSKGKLSRLKYEYARLGDFRRSAELAGNIVARSENLWDKAAALKELVKYQRKSNEFTLALNAAGELDTVLAAFDDWIGVGLGRMAVQEVFELSLSHPQTASACDAFSLADQWFQRSRDLALVGMELGAKAASRCGLSDKTEQYEQIAALERKRIKDALRR